MLEQHGGNVERVLEQVSKIEIRFYQVYVVVSLIRVRDDLVLLQKLSQSKGASRHTIIKLVNIHVRAQYLYEGNQKGDK